MADEYQKGIETAIYAIKWLFRNVPDENLFGGDYVEDILNQHSFQEVLDGINAYRDGKNFHRGDEVVTKHGDSHGVVLRVYPNSVDVMWDDGSAGETFVMDTIRKTGRRYPQVEEILTLLNIKSEAPPEDMEDPCYHCRYYDKKYDENPCGYCKRGGGSEERWVPNGKEKTDNS